jgi:hypothetical protein
MVSISTHSNRLFARSLRRVSVCYGILFLALGATATAADPKNVIKEILDEAIPQFQNTMASMSEGCSGGPNGVPPLNWSGRQKPGNVAIQDLSAARAAMGEDRIEDARKKINSGLSQWDTLINSLAGSCSGGAHGIDPVSYGNYVQFRNQVKERLQTALRFI